jgi:predicted 3-demethylubiquinone-9 3-methyltransferase (glyoxalase superfamily)
MPTITPFLWFDNQAEEAANFYCSIFPNSKVGKITRYSEGAPAPAGTVMTVEFNLDGQDFIGLNGGPHFRFTEAVSFSIATKDQAETDRYWDALLADGGQPSQCGWLKDRFGLSWQVVPEELNKLMADRDPGRARRATQAMLQMVKIDIAKIRQAADAA